MSNSYPKLVLNSYLKLVLNLYSKLDSNSYPVSFLVRVGMQEVEAHAHGSFIIRMGAKVLFFVGIHTIIRIFAAELEKVQIIIENTDYI